MDTNTCGGLDYDSLLASIEKLKLPQSVEPSSFLGLNRGLSTNLFGLPIYQMEADIRPVLQLSEDIPVSDEFRKKCNRYYLDLFGTRDHTVLEKGFSYHTQYGMIVRKDDMRILNIAAMGI